MKVNTLRSISSLDVNHLQQLTILSKAIQAIPLAASSTYSNQNLQRERSIWSWACRGIYANRICFCFCGSDNNCSCIFCYCSAGWALTNGLLLVLVLVLLQWVLRPHSYGASICGIPRKQIRQAGRSRSCLLCRLPKPTMLRITNI